MSTQFVQLYSKMFLPQEDESWSARPSPRLFEALNSSGTGDGSARWIATLEGPAGRRQVALGDPVQLDGTGAGPRWTRSLYVPPWILDSIGLEGDGVDIDIRFEKSEGMPRATHLGFRVIGDIPGEFDIRDLLEEPLSQLGVLEEGVMIPVPILEGCHLYVETCEPVGEPVFLDGAEIALTIEQDVDAVAAATAAPVPPVAEEPPLTSTDFASMIPSSTPPPPAASLSRPNTSNRNNARTNSTFTAFSGAGRRLCDG